MIPFVVETTGGLSTLAKYLARKLENQWKARCSTKAVRGKRPRRSSVSELEIAVNVTITRMTAQMIVSREKAEMDLMIKRGRLVLTLKQERRLVEENLEVALSAT